MNKIKCIELMKMMLILVCFFLFIKKMISFLFILKKVNESI